MTESVLAATERSIAAAVKAKALDLELSAGPIAALRKVAAQIDHEDFPVIGGKFDNVSIPTYLRYCSELRLTPATVEPKKEAGGGSKLGNLRSVAGGKAS